MCMCACKSVLLLQMDCDFCDFPSNLAYLYAATVFFTALWLWAALAQSHRIIHVKSTDPRLLVWRGGLAAWHRVDGQVATS